MYRASNTLSRGSIHSQFICGEYNQKNVNVTWTHILHIYTSYRPHKGTWWYWVPCTLPRCAFIISEYYYQRKYLRCESSCRPSLTILLLTMSWGESETQVCSNLLSPDVTLMNESYFSCRDWPESGKYFHWKYSNFTPGAGILELVDIRLRDNSGIRCRLPLISLILNYCGRPDWI